MSRAASSPTTSWASWSGFSVRQPTCWWITGTHSTNAQIVGTVTISHGERRTASGSSRNQAPSPISTMGSNGNAYRPSATNPNGLNTARNGKASTPATSRGTAGAPRRTTSSTNPVNDPAISTVATATASQDGSQ